MRESGRTEPSGQNSFITSPAAITWGPGQQDMEQQTGSKLGKEYVKAVYCHPAYLTYAEYIMRNAGLEETQPGIKIAGRNMNNLKYADGTTLMAEVGLKLNIQKTKIMTSSPITSWEIAGETVETVSDFIFLGSKITADGDCSHEIKTLTPWKESYDQPR